MESTVKVLSLYFFIQAVDSRSTHDVYLESSAVAAHYLEPDYYIDTPAFKKNPFNFTSYSDLLNFIKGLRYASKYLDITEAGLSQDSRPIHLIEFSKNPTKHGEQFAERIKPTVLIIGQQHGNEMAGGEAALAVASELAKNTSILDELNVLILPRANPDGAARYVRGLTNGDDVNRDHLLLQSPEGQAIADVFRRFNPHVVIDCHEFSVVGRWINKFKGVQRIDGMLQYATVANLAPSLAPTADRVRNFILSAFDSNNLTHEWYYTTSNNNSDKIVSMGGVVPDTGRNIAGLRNSISFLLETRGVGIGTAHFKRRVFTHIIAAKAILQYVAANPAEILETRRRTDADVIASSGKGKLTVLSVHTLGSKNLVFLDPGNGSPKNVTVQWNSALNITKLVERDRPFGYILLAPEKKSVMVLERLGVKIERITGSLQIQSYNVTSVKTIKKTDVTGSVGTVKNTVLEIKVELISDKVIVRQEDFFVSLEQASANIVIAALEPESQSSFAANYLLFNNVTKGNLLPILRVMEKPTRVFASAAVLPLNLYSPAKTLQTNVPILIILMIVSCLCKFSTSF